MDPTLLRNLLILVRLGIVAVGLLAGYLGLYYVIPYLGDIAIRLPGYFFPFILALLMAILIEPLIVWLRRRVKIGRGAAALLSLLIVWGSVSLVVTLVVMRLVLELAQLYRYLSTYSNNLSAELAVMIERIQNVYLNLHLPPQVAEGLLRNMGGLLEWLQHTVQVSVNALVSFLSALPGVFTIFLIATIATFFISRDKDLINDTLFGWAPPDSTRKLRLIIRDLGGALSGFVKAEAILISITGIISFLGLTVLGSSYAVTLAILAGLLDILPILGPGMVYIPWALWQLATGNIAFGCELLILYGIIVFIRQVIEPKVLSQNIGLHPLATMVSLYVGLQVAGVAGMIMGPVVLVVIQALRRAGLISFWPIKPD
ncbi:MAG: sporulation integral membrane protein YtvI [Firmicutes bacterium]|nr:sporulation integral membrane protein YtvI [Bacillota bacterium]